MKESEEGWKPREREKKTNEGGLGREGLRTGEGRGEYWKKCWWMKRHDLKERGRPHARGMKRRDDVQSEANVSV